MLGAFEDGKPTELICLLEHENGEYFWQPRSVIQSNVLGDPNHPPGHEQALGSLSLSAVPGEFPQT